MKSLETENKKKSGPSFFTLTAVYLFALLISPLMSIMKDYLFYYDSYHFI